MLEIDLGSNWNTSRRQSRYFSHYTTGARGVMVIVTGYEHGGTSSIPGQD